MLVVVCVLKSSCIFLGMECTDLRMERADEPRRGCQRVATGNRSVTGVQWRSMTSTITSTATLSTRTSSCAHSRAERFVSAAKCDILCVIRWCVQLRDIGTKIARLAGMRNACYDDGIMRRPFELKRIGK